jgi:hypothetical protein
MDATYIIKYECVDQVKDKFLWTQDYFEAAGYYKDSWIVIEHHITITRPSAFASTKQIISFQWNNNPDFEGVD